MTSHRDLLITHCKSILTLTLFRLLYVNITLITFNLLLFLYCYYVLFRFFLRKVCGYNVFSKHCSWSLISYFAKRWRYHWRPFITNWFQLEGALRITPDLINVMIKFGTASNWNQAVFRRHMLPKFSVSYAFVTFYWWTLF